MAIRRSSRLGDDHRPLPGIVSQMVATRFAKGGTGLNDGDETIIPTVVVMVRRRTGREAPGRAGDGGRIVQRTLSLIVAPMASERFARGGG